MSLEALKSAAAAVAEEMQTFASQETLPPDVRSRFIDVRGELFVRGIYDPVLVRFDSASAPRATNAEIAEQLATVAASL